VGFLTIEKFNDSFIYDKCFEDARTNVEVGFEFIEAFVE
jgi:hypothetical protein